MSTFSFIVFFVQACLILNALTTCMGAAIGPFGFGTGYAGGCGCGAGFAGYGPYGYGTGFAGPYGYGTGFGGLAGAYMY